MEILRDQDAPWGRTRTEYARLMKVQAVARMKVRREPIVARIVPRKPKREVRELGGMAGELGIRAYTVRKAWIGQDGYLKTIVISLPFMSIQDGEQ